MQVERRKRKSFTYNIQKLPKKKEKSGTLVFTDASSQAHLAEIDPETTKESKWY